MNCRDVRDQLSAWLDRELPLEVAWTIEQHLRDCSACANEAQELRDVIGAVSDLPRVKAPQDLAARIAGQLTLVAPERKRSYFLAKYKSIVQVMVASAAVVTLMHVNGVLFPGGTRMMPERALPEVRVAPESAAPVAEPAQVADDPALRKAAKGRVADHNVEKADAPAPGAPDVARAPGFKRPDESNEAAEKPAGTKAKESSHAESYAGKAQDTKGGGDIAGLESKENAASAPPDGGGEALARDRDKSGAEPETLAKETSLGLLGGVVDQRRNREAAKELQDAAPTEATDRHAEIVDADAGQLFGSQTPEVTVVRGTREELSAVQRGLERTLQSMQAEYQVEATGPGRRTVRIVLARKRADQILRVVELSRVETVLRRQKLAEKARSGQRGAGDDAVAGRSGAGTEAGRERTGHADPSGPADAGLAGGGAGGTGATDAAAATGSNDATGATGGAQEGGVAIASGATTRVDKTLPGSKSGADAGDIAKAESNAPAKDAGGEPQSAEGEEGKVEEVAAGEREDAKDGRLRGYVDTEEQARRAQDELKQQSEVAQAPKSDDYAEHLEADAPEAADSDAKLKDDLEKATLKKHLAAGADLPSEESGSDRQAGAPASRPPNAPREERKALESTWAATDPDAVEILIVLVESE